MNLTNVCFFFFFFFLIFWTKVQLIPVEGECSKVLDSCHVSCEKQFNSFKSSASGKDFGRITSTSCHPVNVCTCFFDYGPGFCTIIDQICSDPNDCSYDCSPRYDHDDSTGTCIQEMVRGTACVPTLVQLLLNIWCM